MEKEIFGIGGLGGSGTRVVAQILMDAGIYMGDDLNEENDNKQFARLLKDPKWFDSATGEQINRRLLVFYKLMSQERLSFSDLMEYFRANLHNGTFRKGWRPAIAVINSFNLIKKQMGKRVQNHYWGWKEPNTHILMENIALYFTNLKYIHVLRHGLDMAFSSKKRQMKTWGYKFGINYTTNETPEELTQKQLDYWVVANQSAISNGRRLLGDRFYVLNYEALCDDPKVEIAKLLNFLGVRVGQDKLQQLVTLIKPTTSRGRYKQHDLSIFSAQQIEAVKQLGFSV